MPGTSPLLDDKGAPGGTRGEVGDETTLPGDPGTRFEDDPDAEAGYSTIASSWECTPAPEPEIVIGKLIPPPFEARFVAPIKFPGGKSSSTDTLVGLAHEES